MIMIDVQTFKSIPPENISTGALWRATHSALCAQAWSTAQRGLEALARRAEVKDLLLSADAYRAPAWIRQLIQDRIDAVNRQVG
jgi:hypothetical protein